MVCVSFSRLPSLAQAFLEDAGRQGHPMRLHLGDQLRTHTQRLEPPDDALAGKALLHEAEQRFEYDHVALHTLHLADLDDAPAAVLHALDLDDEVERRGD